MDKAPFPGVPFWPEGVPLPEGAVGVIGAASVEEAQAFLRRYFESEERERRETEERWRRSQERAGADRRKRNDVFEALARLGRGEVKIAPPRQRAPGGGRTPKTIPAMVAGVAARYLIEAEESEEPMTWQDAIENARDDLSVTELQAPTSTVSDRIREYFSFRDP